MQELIALLRSDSNAANAFGALASALAAVLALFVSCASVWIAISAARSQRTHNELSVRPLAEVTVADYESSLRVKLRNNGTGPMIVLAVTVSDGAKALDSLIEWMPPPAWESAMEYLFAHTASSHLAARGRACSARTHGARRRKQLSTVQGLSPASACAFDGQR